MLHSLHPQPRSSNSSDTHIHLDAAVVQSACSNSQHYHDAAVTLVSVCFPGSSYWLGLCPLAKSHFHDYAQFNSFGLCWFTSNLATPRHPAWSKIPAILAAMRSQSAEYVFWSDPDTVFMNFSSHALVLPPIGIDMAYSGYFNSWFDRRCVNAAHMIFRSSSWSQALLRAVWEVYPEPRPADWWMEQASMQYILSGQRQECRNAVLSYGIEYNPSNNSWFLPMEPKFRAHPRDSCCKPQGQWAARSMRVPPRALESWPSLMPFGKTAVPTALQVPAALYQDGDLLVSFPGIHREERVRLLRNWLNRSRNLNREYKP